MKKSSYRHNHGNECLNRSKKIIFLISLSTFIFFGSINFSYGQTKIKAITSLFPLQEFAQEVGGKQADVDLLLPPGAEPHTWEPKPSEVLKIVQADIFIYIGAAMEPWAEKVAKAASGKKLYLLDLMRNLSLSEKAQKLDPHIWLDFTLDLKIIDLIAGALSKIAPPHAPFFQRNAHAYQEKLQELDRKYQKVLATCRQRSLILGGHAAFGYLAQRYGLQQIALSGINPNAEPTPKRMAEVIAITKREKAKFIFAEEMVNPRLAKALAKEAGVQILLLNPGGNLTKKQRAAKVTFLDLMERNLANLKKGLACLEKLE